MAGILTSKDYSQLYRIDNQVTLAISTMLSLTVFLMSVDGGIPETEKIPIISKAIHLLLLLIETWIQNYHFQATPSSAC